MASTAGVLPVSQTMGTMRRPVSAASSAAVASSVSPSCGQAMATSTPSSARVRAIALPMPLLPPVTSAALPVEFEVHG